MGVIQSAGFAKLLSDFTVVDQERKIAIHILFMESNVKFKFDTMKIKRCEQSAHCSLILITFKLSISVVNYMKINPIDLWSRSQMGKRTM